ncbi:aKG-HExxH-type peptide beta-hydroxylase [Dictyobacter formicarum]|uniref:HEXXH motif domain-containing protein n=1 Tax=Dictyobacter formicarum TaxID=2778368 RepID=A0ABQ3V9Z2_9CHLR|nr:HEXXH motif-containing putative peptide modification protein [Dictyobacter formicarum]GHO82599.1 hypothetical protein KSZ_06050 [Dictyobacter formicarum]
MSWEDRLYRVFSCPQENFSNDFLEIITVTYAQELCRHFLARFGEDLQRRSNGLLAFLETWLEHEKATFDTVWNLAFGEVKQVLLPGSQNDHVRTAAALALQLQYSNNQLTNEWSIQLTAPTRLKWGRWLLPTADWLTVSSEGRQVTIRLRYQGKERQVAFRQGDEGWKGENIEQMPQINAGQRRIDVLHLNALNYSAFDDIIHSFAQDLTPDEVSARCQATIMLLHDYADIYLPWVERVVRYIIPLQSENDFVFSSSYADRPGVVTISFPARLAALAEMLVHEATHQYFHLLSSVGNVDDGSDATLYYSPYKTARTAH